jgi:hypothetical protein
MNILYRIKQAFIPVNQPTAFLRLYFIPETTTVQSPKQSSDNPHYRQTASNQHTILQNYKSLFQDFIHHQREAARRHTLGTVWLNRMAPDTPCGVP